MSSTGSPPAAASFTARLFDGWGAPIALVIYAVAVVVLGDRLAAFPALAFAHTAIELAMLMLGVAVAVHHAEDIAHALGEPYGTLVLTLAVTVIECSLILAVMLSGKGNAALARDTVFAVIMLVMNGLVGLCFVIGGLRWGEQTFRTSSARAYLMVLIPFGVLTMVLPGFTTTTAGPYFSTSQTLFVAFVTLALYGIFLYVQTVRHRGFFDVERAPDEAEHRFHWPKPSRYARLSLALVAIVLLAKSFAASMEQAIAAVGAPPATIGVLVALLVLLPESVAAIQAARADQLQRSINLALGSSIATIGLTVPAVGLLSLVLGTPLELGLGPTEMVLLALTFVVSMVTFSGGHTTILSGSVHLVMLATFVFLLFVP